ncbi:MAG: type II secretion system protein [Candidatus Paceibacterota bacterium]
MKNKKLISQGFTLIELLVVIAIIGILTAIIVPDISNLRSKGSNAAVKENLTAIRSQAGIYYDDNENTYGLDISDCTSVDANGKSVFTNPLVARALENALTNAGASPTQVCNTSTDGQKWASSISPLKDASEASWCVDSSGWNKTGIAANGICSE